LGAVIIQDRKSIDYYLLKLNKAKKQYTTTERERERERVVISYWNLQGIQEYPVRLSLQNIRIIIWWVKSFDSVLQLVLLLEEYEVPFEYLPGNKNVVVNLSGSENNSTSNIKLTIPMHMDLIFKEQAKFKDTGLREKGLAQPYYSIKYIEGYGLLCYKDNKQDLLSSIIEKKNTVLVSWIFTSSRTDKNRKDYQEYQDMAWSYSRCWTLIVHVPLVKYVKWKRRNVRNMGCYHPK
jgi:hypothetical protein